MRYITYLPLRHASLATKVTHEVICRRDILEGESDRCIGVFVDDDQGKFAVFGCGVQSLSVGQGGIEGDVDAYGSEEGTIS